MAWTASNDAQQLGPEVRRPAIEAWAARQGVRVVAWHVDTGVSGAAPIGRRPALLDSLHSLAQHGSGLLVVARGDRSRVTSSQPP